MARQMDPNLGKFLGYGSNLAAGVFLGVLLGRWIDNKFKIGPYGSLICIIVGTVSGLYLLIRDGIRANKD